MRVMNVTMNAQKIHNPLTLVPTFIYRMNYKKKKAFHCLNKCKIYTLTEVPCIDILISLLLLNWLLLIYFYSYSIYDTMDLTCIAALCFLVIETIFKNSGRLMYVTY